MRREGKMDLAKGAANTVLDTLSPQDNVSTQPTKKDDVYSYTSPGKIVVITFSFAK